jgi:pimeloyl-ACP methyl ester carboxylesterase
MTPRLRLFAHAVTISASLLASGPMAADQSPAGAVTEIAAGSGTPAIVFESGLGDGADTWRALADDLARDTTVFAYTRGTPADGETEAVVRTGPAVVAELRSRLRALGLKPPYLLVGHSLGGLYVQLFAKLHPDEIAGLVLIDSSHPDQRARLRAELPDLAQRNMERGEKLPGRAGAEFRGLEPTGRACREAGPFPTAPALVLSSTGAAGSDPRGVEFMQRLRAEIAADIPGAEPRLVPESGHYIHLARPDAAAAAIREVLAKARAARGLGGNGRTRP